MSVYTAVVFGLEYLYDSAMEYLTRQYMNQLTQLTPLDLPDSTWREIQDGESAARWAAESYTGPIDGNTVI